ncbi:ABC transporter substrate-binding protein [Salisaeta longa]|uniref:ABC transporter substrate-binding protein n=1 Tax=Salisaeta longa TaxID=503170 RepID=UPI0003B733C5|nr:ABC transporter substrate-binding protein [Salisaeta longa]
MRIVSLLPAATEWICAFGRADALVGRSHECEFPPEAVQDVPVLTRATYESGDDSAAIDHAVQQHLHDGLSLYAVDLERLRAARPDVIVTQDQCDVCAVSRSDLQHALADWTGTAPEVVSLAPQTLKEVLDDALRLGRTLEALPRAMACIAACERRLRRLHERLGRARRADPSGWPTVACIEWMEPLMTAGHWMPDVVDQAGGRAVCTTGGRPSQRVAWSDLQAADPDVIALLPCGFSIETTRQNLHYLTQRPGWHELSAVRAGRVALLDGNAYFNRPGPRLYRSIELMAAVLHGPSAAITPEAWELQSLAACAAGPSSSA